MDIEGTDTLPGFNGIETSEIIKAPSIGRTTKTFIPSDNNSISTIWPRFVTPKDNENDSAISLSTQKSTSKITAEASVSSLSESVPPSSDCNNQIQGLKSKLEKQQQQQRKMDEQYQTILQLLHNNKTNNTTSVTQESHSSTDKHDPGANTSSGERLL